MSNVIVGEVNATLKNAAADLTKRANPQKAHLGNAAKLLKDTTALLGQFLNLDPTDPALLDQRVTKLTSAVGKLKPLLQVKTLNPPEKAGLDIEGHIKNSCETLKNELAALTKVNLFFKKNTSRWEHGLEKASGFDKKGRTYVLSKGLVKGKLQEKGMKHTRKELGTSLSSNYSNWLFKRRVKYKDKSTAYTVTRFLLEDPRSETWVNKKSPPFKKLGFRKTTFEELPDHQIRFVEGTACATVTVREGNPKSYLYLGWIDKSIAPRLWTLHTLQKTVDIDGKKADFLPRTRLAPFELPWSLKYAMRHDVIFLDIVPSDAHRKHADPVSFKSVQSAGGIVVQKGKVVAIDNVSGHYAPSWRLLEQAVQKIKKEGAFHPNAMVGVYTKYTKYTKKNKENKKVEETWFFPYEVFLKLASDQFSELALSREGKTAKSWRLPRVDGKLQSHLEKGLRKQTAEVIKKFGEGARKT